jgi:hypothetical protein
MNSSTTSQKFKSKLNSLLSECNFQSNKPSYLSKSKENIKNKTPNKENSNQTYNTISSPSRVNSKIKKEMENIKFDYLSKDRNMKEKDYSSSISDLYKNTNCVNYKQYSISRSIQNCNDRSFSNISKASKDFESRKNTREYYEFKKIRENKENYDYNNMFKPRNNQSNKENTFKKKTLLLEDRPNSSNKSLFLIENHRNKSILNEEDEFYSSKPSQVTKIQREFQRLNNLINEFEKKDNQNEGKYQFNNGNLLNRQQLRINKIEINDFNPYLSVSKDYQFRLLSRSKNKIIK